MMLNRNNRQNPVLEIKRDGYLAEEKEIRDNLLEIYKISIIKTKHLHANLLFTTSYGHSILSDICRYVTFVDPSITNTNWRDLALKLGYTEVDIKCINNLKGNIYDPTELILQYYAATKKEGTVGEILQAILEVGFLPALHQVQKHIDKFLAEVEAGESDVIEAPLDEGCDLEPETKNLLKAANFKPFVPAIFDSLPSKESAVKLAEYSITREEGRVQMSKSKTKSKHQKKYCKYVMLSFANDGYSTALKIASILRKTTNKKGLPIGVLLLCENDQIQGNPGHMIPDILAKMDFVIPVLTEGYFSALKQPNPRARMLDERYIQFIYDILISKYIHNNCLNLQVRPIIQSHAVNTIYYKQEFINNSIFNAWKSDDEIPALADTILKSHRSKITVSG